MFLYASYILGMSEAIRMIIISMIIFATLFFNKNMKYSLSVFCSVVIGFSFLIDFSFAIFNN